MSDEPATLAIRAEDLDSMLKAMEADDTIHWCEVCGAWLEDSDNARASTGDFEGCWKAATRDARYDHLCRSYRGTMIDEMRLKLKAPVEGVET